MTKTPHDPTFSIITPTRNRDGRYERGALSRCFESVARQTYPKNLYEHIIIDDGNEEPDYVKREATCYEILGPKYTIIRHNEPTERYIAYNDGMREAKNDWIVFLDDDDEYVPFYLEYLAEAIKQFPEYKVFNYGGLVCHKRGLEMRARDVVSFEQKVGCTLQSGDIVNGQFAFHRSALKHKDVWMPDTSNLWKAYDMADIPGYGDGKRPLGNPWGNDFYIFYKLTRHYISKPLKLYLFICHTRGSE